MNREDYAARREAYLQKLRDPRWQKKRLEIFQRDGFTCLYCGAKDRTLHVHHGHYLKDREPWDYPDCLLLTLCEICHESETENRRDSEEFLIRSLRWYGMSSQMLIALADSMSLFFPAAPHCGKDDFELFQKVMLLKDELRPKIDEAWADKQSKEPKQDTSE